MAVIQKLKGQQQLATQFKEAIKKSDAEMIRQLIRDYPDLARDWVDLYIYDKNPAYRGTVLLYVIKKNDNVVFQSLLAIKGLDLYQRRDNTIWSASIVDMDKNPLFVAIKYGRREMVKCLLQHASYPKQWVAQCPHGQPLTPLLYAYRCQQLDIFRDILISEQSQLHTKLPFYKPKIALHVLLQPTLFDSDYPDNQPFMKVLVAYYSQLMVKKPRLVQQLWIQFPELPSLLLPYKPLFWHFIQKAFLPTRMATDEHKKTYFQLLKAIDDSRGKSLELQHPFYTILAQRSLFKSTLGFFFQSDSEEIQSIQASVTALSFTTNAYDSTC